MSKIIGSSLNHQGHIRLYYTLYRKVSTIQTLIELEHTHHKRADHHGKAILSTLVVYCFQVLNELSINSAGVCREVLSQNL